MQPIVEIRKLAFAYTRARPVLRDIDLAIPRGSVVGIMGQSGCGKTTLLRVIMGALRPTAGEARVVEHGDRGAKLVDVGQDMRGEEQGAALRA